MDDPFYLVDMGRLMDLYQKWVEVLPAVKPFYAIKSNPDPALLNMLGALGTGFDCASKVCTFYQSCWTSQFTALFFKSSCSYVLRSTNWNLLPQGGHKVSNV